MYKKKRIISFSLWGKIRLYCIGAIKNALLAQKYFPEWICRFYYDSSVPLCIINYLNSLKNTELYSDFSQVDFIKCLELYHSVKMSVGTLGKMIKGTY